nr:ABC transporter ATP-binding protein [Kibdelosporangium sp. MJ126-NF4]CTQ93674.1 ABC transporter ATP-binding protein [Kibdelosporangium sp. MJ126-NF4]
MLDGVHLTIEPGETTVIVAGNGVGKSTLLRIVADASVPTGGRVTGRPDTVGYVPERAPAAIRMTARNYLAHVGRMRGLSTRETRVRTNELAERLRLVPGPDVPIAALSKGNGQKVAVMQAFLKQPELLVVDEPATGLDAPARAELAALMAQAEQDGARILLSVHESAVSNGRLYRLRDGRLVPEALRGMRVSLRPTRPGLRAADLGVEVLLEEPGRVVLRTDDADKLLLTALADGWSLIEAVS